MTEIIKKYYEDNMPSYIVPRLSLNDFSSCGGLTSPLFKSQNATVVMFYTPMCRFCQEFSGELTKFSTQYGKKINAGVAVVDMSNPDNSPLVQMSKKFPYSIGELWPTVIIFYKGQPCSSYESSRTSSALNDYIIKNIGIGRECSFKFVPCD